jgi:8-oxo-dGTP pyrophosphatase MutT (NUDIX family)
MPLQSGSSREVIAHNVREMEASGHSHKQAVAAALHNAYDSGAGVLLTHGERALFLKRGPRARDHAGEWCCAGGSIEGGETPEQAAKRETQEETGYPVGDIMRIDEGAGFATFRANVDEEFTPRLNHEHTEHVWAPIDDPPHPLHPGVAATLRKLLTEAVAGGEQELEAQRRAKALLGAQDRREYDTNNWFQVFDNPLSKVGVYKYSEASVIKGGDPRKMVGVYRSPEELGAQECVESFRLMPWTDDHPDTLLGAETQGLVPAEQKGVHGVIGERTFFRDGTLFGNLKVFSESLARKLAAGKRELSCGYHCDFVPQEGVFEGEPYQYVQKNMRGNHLSSVARGRMGSDVRVLDAAYPLMLSFALDLKEVAVRKDEQDCALDADTQKFIEDSFGSLVGELEKKGYSKEYATKVAGKVAAEKGMVAHDAISGVTSMPTTAKDSEIKDSEGKESPGKKKDLETESADARAARDAESAEEKEDQKESAKDASEEKEDGDKDDKEARDRRRARDRRAGARDARKAARDKRAKDAKDAADAQAVKAAKDAADAKAATDAKAAADAAAAAAAKGGKGMDAAEVAALVKQEVAANTASIVPAIRKEEASKHKLYERLSPIVGAFDHAEMSHVEMAAYGLKQLGVTDAAADPVTALDFLLMGRTQVAEAQQRSRPRAAQDSSGDTFIDRYVNAA